MEYILNFTVTFLELYGIWFLFGIIAIALILYIFFEDYRKKIPQKISIPLSIVFLVLPAIFAVFLLFINPFYCGYGYSTDNFKAVAHNNEVLWGFDNYITSSAGIGEGPSVYYKIQGINNATGKKLFTKLITEDFEIKGQHQNFVWAYTNKEYIGMDISSGKATITINEKILVQHFQKLSSGVYEYTYNAETALFDITSKDGIKMSVDPVANKEVVAIHNHKLKDSYYMNEYSVSDSLKKTIIKFSSEGERQKLVDGSGKILNSNLFFLNSSFLLLDNHSKNLFIISYETLEKKNFLLRCVTTAGKLVWERKQNDLGVRDFFTELPEYESAFFCNHDIIFSFNGFVFSLKASNGELNWLTRM